MTVLESPVIFIDGIRRAIPNFMLSKQAYASAANAEETFLCITVFSTNKSPFWSHPTSPDADLKFHLSKAASNWIAAFGRLPD
uniref:Uncharacterized protein n=1 Tax=Gossypium raimondii TaxID=29730 RepID=A0A0D2MBS5_GOSRA|nr:hypothetical protein B456_002G162500 [Gossypium raimondii]